MKRITSFLLVVTMMLASVLAMIPASAVTAGPYNYTAGSIKSINVSTTKSLENG